MIRLILAFLALTLPASACTDQVPCELGDRSYHVKVPDDWDGVTPMPVMLHFHGWARQGTLIVKHSRISGATRKRGVLLLAPNGRSKTWDFWRPGSDDTDFAAAVIEDAAKTYPIDRSRIFISGYSFGSAMAWRYVCENGADVAALFAVAGSLNQDETCETAPAEVRHVHGTSDTVMDFPMGRNGDTTFPVALWREHFACTTPSATSRWNTTRDDVFDRTEWTCPGGKVVLDVHKRGHFIPRGWIARQLDDVLGLTPGEG